MKKVSYLLSVVCPIFFLQCKSWGKFWEVGTISINALGARSTGELWTNTLIGTATGPVASVELSIGGGSWAAATGTNSWRYSIPFSANLKVGKSYTFSARALGSDGNLMATQTGVLLRQQNHDINGDGYADFVVAAKARNTSTGSVYIYYGSANLAFPASASLAPAIITGGGTQRSFGTSLALGDINGDGFSDLAVGGEQYPTALYQGGMWIYYGSANGIASQAALVTPAYTGLANSDYYGGAIAVCDLNGDGYQDISVGARERSSQAGELYSYLGSASGLALAVATTKTGTTGERVGSSLACADVNNDGLADLVAGARTSANGTVYVFHGNASGFNTVAAATIQGEASGDGLGEGIFAGDYNNDGSTDLIVQARDRNAGAGASQGVAYLLPGSASGFSNFSANSSTHVNFSGELAGSTFGSRAVITDANGDGLRDIFLSAYLPASAAGAVYYMPGSGFSSQNASALANKISGITAGDAFGIALAVKDLNGDGNPDMIAGAYNRNAGAGAGQGALSIFLGQGSGFSSQNSAAANLTIAGEAAGDNFAWPVH